ncbi:MAG: hypothetical protein AAF384_00890 [Pseudomonadota bacterium]
MRFFYSIVIGSESASRSELAARQTVDVPLWLWLWFPPLLLLIIAPIRVIDPTFYSQYIDGERGLIELATPVVAFCALYFGIRASRLAWRSHSRAVATWITLVTVGSFYFAGEELSWGQHLFGWQTPEVFLSLNNQAETNLHNMSSWLDQKPRLLLELWVLVGGLIVPLVARKKPPTAGGEFGRWFWPPHECFVAAALAIAIRMPERLKELFAWPAIPYEIRYSEPQEYYFALFLLIYLFALSRRLR